MVQRLPSRRRTRQIGFAVVALVVLFIISLSTIVRLYTDLLWYREIHFTSVFWTVIRSETLLGVGLGLVFFLFCLANLFIVAHLIPVYSLAAGDPNDPLTRYRSAALPYLSWIAAGGSAFLALLFGLSAAPMWSKLVLASHSVPFHSVDPVFHRDLSFYVFKLPFDQFLYGWAFAALVVVTLVVATAHYATGGIKPQSSTERVTPQVKAHLSVLIGLIALLKAWGYRLGEYNLLYSNRGGITGASYTGVHAELPALRLLVVISIIGSILFLVNIRFRGWALPIVGAGLWLFTSILVAGVYPFVIQRFVVLPSQLQKETPYIQRNIAATRAAYGINITQTPYTDAGTITPQILSDQASVLNSVRLWDPATLETAYQTLQEIRPYYSFLSVNPDRYLINGALQQVEISARELNTSGLPGQNWVNQHLIYTHGYGADVSPVNQRTPEGQPQFLVQNIPPTTTVASLQITQPDIYFGESQAGAYTLVDSNQKELDFSSPTQDVYSHYSGSGGIKVSSFFRRALYAWRFKDLNILISGLVGAKTKIIYYSQIQERLLKAAPFINWDTNPYSTIVNGRVVWVADGYTVTNQYPYSQQTDFTDRTTRQVGPLALSSIQSTENYIRNSVKATIDAHDGTVKLYIWDPNDPIVRAWAKAFPEVFSPASAMPAAIASHARYPEDLFSVQTGLYQTYHVTNVQTFFAKSDIWAIPPDPNQQNVASAAGHAQEVQPYYVLMTLPGTTTPSYVLVLPMNPSGKQNMTSLVVAQSATNFAGQQFRDLHFPPGQTIDGVGQVHARINADSRVSQARTLLGQQGSTVTFGNLLVIPIGNSLLYVEPMFVSAQSNAVPLLENVIVATSSQVSFSATLQESLQQLANGSAAALPTVPNSSGTPNPTPSGSPTPTPSPTPSGPGTVQGLSQQALQLLQGYASAESQGDFATAGQDLAQLKALLNQGANPTGTATPAPSPTK